MTSIVFDHNRSMTVRTIVANLYAAEGRFSRLTSECRSISRYLHSLNLVHMGGYKVSWQCPVPQSFTVIWSEIPEVYSGPFPGGNFDESGYFLGAWGGREI